MLNGKEESQHHAKRQVGGIVMLVLGVLVCLSGIMSLAILLLFMALPMHQSAPNLYAQQGPQVTLRLIGSPLQALYGALLAIAMWALQKKIVIPRAILTIGTMIAVGAIIIAAMAAAYVVWLGTAMHIFRVPLAICTMGAGFFLAGLAIVGNKWLRELRQSKSKRQP